MNGHQTNDDFRIELYKKYISTYKKYIGEDNRNAESDYKIYRKRYIPLLKTFDKKDVQIIELGCGTGYILQFLKQEGFENLYGIDISEQQIERAQNKGLTVEVKNIFEFTKSESKKYDVVFALDFVEHFGKNELLDLFNGINNILNNKGILIIHTPNGQGIFPGKNIYGDLTHLTVFNPNSLMQILQVTGFDEIKFFETGPVSKNLKGLLRLILWKIIKLAVKTIKLIETGDSGNIYTQDFICTAKKTI